MDIRAGHKGNEPLVAAVVAIIVLGVGSLLLTWKSIERQRSIAEDHMVLSGKAIVRGVEANLMRLMRSLRAMPDPAQRMAVTKDYFGEIVSSQDILFAGIFTADGEAVAATGNEELDLTAVFPPDVRSTPSTSLKILRISSSRWLMSP